MDEKNVTCSSPLVLKITIFGELIQIDDPIQEEQADEKANTDFSNKTFTGYSSLGDLVTSMNLEKAFLREKYADADYDEPTVRIKKVSKRGVIHLNFGNKMKVFRPPEVPESRLLSSKETERTIYQEYDKEMIDVKLYKNDQNDFVYNNEFGWQLQSYEEDTMDI